MLLNYNAIIQFMEKAIFAGGCFWCTEAIFRRLKGVNSVISGYTGGTLENPTYEKVSKGITGHAEAVITEFDPKIISYEKLLEIFFFTHDPTTLNRQGNDIGTQYRSAVFYLTEEQRIKTERFIEKLEGGKVFSSKIVTKVEPYKNFYIAEDYHEDYYEKNKEAPYCTYVIDPKIKKLYKEYENEIKVDNKSI
jgi:peptide-methionine (S)-S-oxide reductase